MNSRHWIRALLLALVVVWSGAAKADEPASVAKLVAPDKIDAIVKPLIDEGWLDGVAIGLVSEKGTQTAGYGQISDKNSTPPTPETLFEIGSVSKIFTGLLLAQMIEDHTVSLTEPVQKLLGDSITMPKSDDREITLVDLVTHSAGLPRMPSNFNPKDPNNPYADYTAELMGKFVSGYKLKRKPGEKSEYSNLGMGLLGQALALKSGKSYEDLMKARICEPLAMTDTVITLDEARKARIAQGHDFDRNPAANWDIPAMAGAGAIRSTVADMLKLVSAELALQPTPLAAAITASQKVQYTNPAGADNDVAMAWMVRRADGGIWHNGQTGGYHSFVGFSPEKKVGVVVLSNTAASQIDSIGAALLKLMKTGEVDPPKVRKSIKLAAAELDPLVGSYSMGLAKVDITRDGEQLVLELTGQPKVKFYPESKTKFFCRAVEATISFEAGDDGQIKKLVLHQNGLDVPATRSK